MPGTPEEHVEYSARKELLVNLGRPKNTAVDTVIRNTASGFKREHVGLQFLTPVEQIFVKEDGFGIHVAPVCVTNM